MFLYNSIGKTSLSVSFDFLNTFDVVNSLHYFLSCKYVYLVETMENVSIKVLRDMNYFFRVLEKRRCIISCELSLLTWIVFLKSYHWELLFLDFILLSCFLDVIIGKTFNRVSFKSPNIIDMVCGVLVGEQLLHWGKNMIQTMWIGYYHVVKESTPSCVNFW